MGLDRKTQLLLTQYMTAVSPHLLWWKSDADFHHQESVELIPGVTLCLILIYNICKIQAQKEQ